MSILVSVLLLYTGTSKDISNKMSDDWQPTRARYTLAEDMFIIDYICNSRSYDRVKGAALWKSLSSRMQVKRYFRTYLSLKERYTKHIIPNIQSYHLQSAEVANLLRPFEEQQNQPKKKGKKVKNLRKEYSLKDDERLIKWVLKEKGDVKGNKIWQELEAKNVIEGRTWESLKNRFLRSTIKNLHLLLDEKDHQKILRRINGDLEPAVHPTERNEYQAVAAKLKEHTLARRDRKRALSPSVEPVAGTSKTCPICQSRRCTCPDQSSSSSPSNRVSGKGSPRKRPFITSTPNEGGARSQANPHCPGTSGRRLRAKNIVSSTATSRSSSTGTSSSSSFLRSGVAPDRMNHKTGPRSSCRDKNGRALRSKSDSPNCSQDKVAPSQKAGKKKLYTMGSDLASKSPFPVTPARPNEPPPRKAPTTRSSASDTPSKAATGLLDRGDRQIRGNVVSTSSTSDGDLSCATTRGAAKEKDCSCTDFVVDEAAGSSEVDPCGSDCRILNIPEKSLRPTERVSTGQERRSPAIRRRRSESPKVAERTSLCPSDHNSDRPDDGMGEKEEFFMDPLYADYCVGNDDPCVIKDGFKMWLGTLSFPIVIPWQ